MEGDDPAGERWNLDQENRESFGEEGPPEAKEPVHHRLGGITREVLDEVAERFPDLPGELDSEVPDAFDWPVTREEAPLPWLSHPGCSGSISTGYPDWLALRYSLPSKVTSLASRRSARAR